jgi:predicted DCC family thiol-disulfide oxidoreductase YuxK
LQVTGIVIFDGICNLCTRSVKFILRHEAKPEILFAPLQSAAGARLLSNSGFDPSNPSTFVFISEGVVYTKSAAAIHIAGHLKGAWRLVRLVWLVPRPLRDWAYDAVARSRYQWFGKSDSCMVPTPDLKSRVLND